MKLPFISLSPKVFIFALLVLVGIPVTVFLVSQQQNLEQQASVYPKCAPDGAESGWPECRYGQPTHNTQACRNRAETFKGVDGPNNDNDSAWFTWAQEPPKPLSCGTACGLAPSYCIVDNTPTPVPSDTPRPPTNTPRPPTNTPRPPTPTPTTPPNSPTPTDIPPTATDVPPTPTDSISSCPVPRVPETGLNVKIECPFCE